MDHFLVVNALLDYRLSESFIGVYPMILLFDSLAVRQNSGELAKDIIQRQQNPKRGNDHEMPYLLGGDLRGKVGTQPKQNASGAVCCKQSQYRPLFGGSFNTHYLGSVLLYIDLVTGFQAPMSHNTVPPHPLDQKL